MFAGSKFNGDISQWDVGNVENIIGMFYESKFNGDISKWNVSNIKNMYRMFDNSEFSQDLTDWKPLSLKNKKRMFDNCLLPIPYWAEAEDTPSAVRSYLLEKELQSKLENKNLINKKVKI